MSAVLTWNIGLCSFDKWSFCFLYPLPTRQGAFFARYRVHPHFDPYSIRAPASLDHLQILDKFLSPTSSTQALGARAEDLRINISKYLLRHRFYSLLAKALGNIVRLDHLL
jgi:hypothetical protein